jgi:hypothetical protein
MQLNSSFFLKLKAGSTALLLKPETRQHRESPNFLQAQFFFWLALHRRLWTAARRKRHGLQDDDACVLCSQEPETADHLIIGCAFTRELWFGLLDPLGLTALLPTASEDVAPWWLRQRLQLDGDARPAFDSMLQDLHGGVNRSSPASAEDRPRG